MDSVLVTGASGFTGSHLVNRLIKNGARVRALVREKTDAGFLRDMGAGVYTGDITDRKAVFRAVRGAGLVFHAAAAFREAKLPDSVYRQVNLEGTRNVLDAGLEFGVKRIVHCSTIGVYGDVSQIPTDEKSPFNPGDIYQQTKLEGEALARRYFLEKSAPVVILRPCGIYGPGDMRFLKLFRSIAGKKFFMIFYCRKRDSSHLSYCTSSPHCFSNFSIYDPTILIILLFVPSIYLPLIRRSCLRRAIAKSN